MFSKENIIKAKLHAPQIPSDFVVRSAIDKKLMEKSGTSIFLFSAPSGYGKSTTVIEWLQGSGVPYCWLSLDENDNIPRKFIIYLLLAFQELVPGFGKEIAKITSSSQEISSGDYQVMLSNALDSIDKDLYLVLDDYHFIHNQEIHDLIISLFRFPQPHLKLVITSRKDPPFPLSTWRMKNMLTEIRARELSFDSGEINQFFHNQQNKAPLKDSIEKIEEFTEGWVTGLRLLSISGIDRNPNVRLGAGSSLKSNKVLLELIHEMLLKQKPEVRTNILKMSVVDEFTPELYQLITDLEKEGSESDLKFEEFINMLMRSNLFLISLDDGQQGFRFHHLFLDLLRQAFLKEFSDDEIKSIYERLSVWHEKNDQVEKCIELMLKLDRKSEAIRFFTKKRAAIFEEADWPMLETLLNMFDDKTIENSIVLNLSYAWLYIYKGDIQSMMSMLPGLEQQCLELGIANKKRGCFLGEINVLKAYYRYNFDIDMLVCLDHASTALELLSKDNLYAKGLAWVFYGGALQALGKSRIAKRDILVELDGTNSSVVRSNLYLILCYIHWMDGNILELSAVSSALISLGKSNNLKEAEANGYYFSGCANFSCNKRDEALRDFKRLYDLRHFTLMVHRFFGSAALAFLLIYRDDDLIRELLQELRLNAMERAGIQYVGFVQAISATVNWIKSKSPESLRWASETPHLPLLPMSNFTSNPMMQSYILASSGEVAHSKKAIEILDDCQAFLKKYNNVNFLMQSQVLKSLALVCLAEPEEAGEEFKKALKLAVPRGLSSAFLVFEQKDLQNLMENIQISDAEKGFLEDVLRLLHFTKRKKKNLLSKRELEILEHLRENLNNKEIGTKLFISESTVKRHVANIYKKLGVHNRHQVLEKSRELSL